jgi:hypothetical protein
MIEINRHRPVRLHTVDTLPSNCSCTNSNGTIFRSPNTTISVIEYFIIEKKENFDLINSFVFKSKLINSMVLHVIN